MTELNLEEKLAIAVAGFAKEKGADLSIAPEKIGGSDHMYKLIQNNDKFNLAYQNGMDHKFSNSTDIAREFKQYFDNKNFTKLESLEERYVLAVVQFAKEKELYYNIQHYPQEDSLVANINAGPNVDVWNEDQYLHCMIYLKREEGSFIEPVFSRDSSPNDKTYSEFRELLASEPYKIKSKEYK